MATPKGLKFPMKFQSHDSVNKWETELEISVHSLSPVWLFVTPWTAACQASLSITNSRSLLKLMSIKPVMPSNHLILCFPLFFLPSVFSSIRVFSNESTPKYWSFTSVFPMNIHGWSPFGLTNLISLQSKGLSRVFSCTIIQKCQFFSPQSSLWTNSHTCTWQLEEP